MLGVLIAIALAQATEPTAVAGARPFFPLQAQLSGAAGFGSTVSLRGQLAISGALGEMHFSEAGEGRGWFLGMGVLGFVEQPDFSACTRSCARGGVGPFLRYGFAGRALFDEPLPALAHPDWYVGFDLAALYSQQFVGIPLAGPIDAYGLRLGVSVTGPGFTRRFFRGRSKRSGGDNPALAAQPPPRFDAVAAIFGILNHAGIHAELSRQHTGELRGHAGFALGAGF